MTLFSEPSLSCNSLSTRLGGRSGMMTLLLRSLLHVSDRATYPATFVLALSFFLTANAHLWLFPVITAAVICL